MKTALIIMMVCAVIISTSACSIVYPAPQDGIASQDSGTEHAGVGETDDGKSEDHAQKPAVQQNEETTLFGSKAGSEAASETSIAAETETEEESTKAVIKREDILSQVPHYKTRHYISQLDEELLINFAKAYIAARDHEESCSFYSKLTKDELDALIFALKYDCPELFCLDNIRTYYREGDDERNIISVNIDYVMSREEYQEKLEEAERTIHQVISMGTEDAYGRRLAAYEYLTNNCNYNTDTRNCGNAYGALVEKQTKCDGISLAYMWIMEEMGENCFVVAGAKPGDTQGHGWNVVRQGENYYASDLTADLSNVFLSGKSGNWYPAFNTSTDWVEDMYPISETPKLFSCVTDDDMTQSYHARNGSFCYRNDDEYQMIYHTIDEAALSEDNTALIQFETGDMYEYFLDNYGGIVAAWAEDNKCMNVEYTYGSIEGYHTVQLMIMAYETAQEE